MLILNMIVMGADGYSVVIPHYMQVGKGAIVQLQRTQSEACGKDGQLSS